MLRFTGQNLSSNKTYGGKSNDKCIKEQIIWAAIHIQFIVLQLCTFYSILTSLGIFIIMQCMQLMYFSNWMDNFYFSLRGYILVSLCIYHIFLYWHFMNSMYQYLKKAFLFVHFLIQWEKCIIYLYIHMKSLSTVYWYSVEYVEDWIFIISMSLQRYFQLFTQIKEWKRSCWLQFN